MALFEYKGMTSGGKATRGVIEADSSKTARVRLKQRGIFTTEIKERAKSKQSQSNVFSVGKVNQKAITMMTRQLATLVKARIPLDEALSALVEQTEDNKLKEILSQVREGVNQGKSLAASCKLFPKVFSMIFVSMIQVGEASGNLDLVLARLSDFAEAQQGLRQKIVGALAYPAFMMVAGLGITIFLFAFAFS